MKSFKLVPVLLALGLSGAAMADTSASDLFKKYEVSVGTTMHQETYRETYQGQRVMQEKGVLYGLSASAAYKIDDVSKVQFNGLIARGNSDYTGSYQGGSYGDVQIPGQSRELSDVSAVYKRTYPSLNNVTFGAGLGYRVLTDRLSEAGEGGYDRENRMLYGTLSVERSFALSDGWTATPSANLRIGLKTKQFSDIYTGLTHKQSSVVGTELAVKFQSTNAKLPVFITPHIRAYKVGQSDVVENTVEPQNKTTEVGVSVGLQF